MKVIKKLKILWNWWCLNIIKKIKKYRDKIPLFLKENIENKLNEIFETKVKLNSGGYLVINPTEALVSIDVNSGKSIKQKNIESTALNTNLGSCRRNIKTN